MLQVTGYNRADGITRTGVIEPYSPVNPVGQARGLPNAFMRRVRPDGPEVYAAPSTREIAAAAEAVAVEFRQGRGARVFVSGQQKVLEPDKQPTGVVWASIWQAAKASANGTPSLVQAWAQPDALVRVIPGSGEHPGALVQAPSQSSGQSIGGQMREAAFSRALGFPSPSPASEIPMPIHAPDVAAMTQAPNPDEAPLMKFFRRQARYTP